MDDMLPDRRTSVPLRPVLLIAAGVALICLATTSAGAVAGQSELRFSPNAASAPEGSEGVMMARSAPGNTTNESSNSSADPAAPPYNATELREQASSTAGVAQTTSDTRGQYLLQTTEVTEQRLAKLKSLDASIEVRHRNLLQIRAPSRQLPALRQLAWVSSVSPLGQAAPTEVSEGVSILNADRAHARGITGADVEVGVIDRGFDPNNSEISGNVATVRSFHSRGITGADTRHGTAVSEIVVDTAPNASLHLVSFERESAQFVQSVDYLIEQDVDVIVDSYSFFGFPRDGSHPVSKAYTRAQKQGIVTVSAAGNSAQKHWEGPARDSDDNTRIEVNERGTERIYLNDEEVIQGSESISLYWGQYAEPSNQDYDLALYKQNQGDDTLVAASTNPQSGKNYGREEIRTGSLDPGIYYLVITNVDADGSQTLNIDTKQASIVPNVSRGSITAPASGVGVIGVGAFSYADFAIPSYSSHGPTDDGRRGVDVVAPTGVSTVGLNPFGGTSAAAPHIAGLTALALQANTSLSPEAVTERVQQSATDTGPPGVDIETGYGRPDAEQLLTSQGTVSGVIATETGRPVSDATVRLLIANTEEVVSSTTTDDQGRYVLTDVTTGQYILEVELGQNTNRSELFLIPDGGTVSPEVSIIGPAVELSVSAPAPVQPGSTVTVTAEVTNRDVPEANTGVINLSTGAAPLSLANKSTSSVSLGGGDTPIPAVGNTVSQKFELIVAEEATVDQNYTLTAEARLQNADTTRNATTTQTVPVSNQQDPIERFDGNGNGEIDRREAISAVIAFNQGQEGVERRDVIEVIIAFNKRNG